MKLSNILSQIKSQVQKGDFNTNKHILIDTLKTSEELDRKV